MKKFISFTLSLSMLCSSMLGLTAKAENSKAGEVIFTHQNVVGSQTCYGDDTEEKTITSIPDVIQGMRINQPVFRAKGLNTNEIYTVEQKLKDGKVVKSEKITATSGGVLEFKHVRNCEAVEILSGETVVASLGTELQYTNGVAITSAPMSYQIYQRNENDEAEITIKGEIENNAAVSVKIGDNTEDVTVMDNEFTYTKTLTTGLYDITVLSGSNEVAKYEQVGVGDIWVAAGQSNMTDMGAITDSFAHETADPINENMHIIYAEDCKWQQMSHPCGEGRFFKTGIRTSPVTSFAREIAASENVPVGIVQSSVGGTNIYQWIDGVRNDANSGYLFNALKSCFDKMPSTKVKGILWYQGCNDAINETYAYSYKDLQQKIFDAFRGFFGADVPIITTQLNDANQDSTDRLGYYDAWSYVKNIQRQNESFYDDVYVVGTGELELGDTIHNNAASNVKLGAKWANAAKNVVYGDTSVKFRTPSIDTAKVTKKNEITLTFKDTNSLKAATGTKRIGITNVSGGGYKIELGDLKKEFVVRSKATEILTASNSAKGDEMTITNAEIGVDGKTVVLTTSEELTAPVAVDCMYGKRFTPTLVDAQTDESVLAFYNVMADLNGVIDAPAEKANQFGSAYNEIHDFDSKSSLEETTIGNSGFKVSTNSSNYNNVVVMNNATKAKNGGYYPYGNGLADNGYYLFFGSGGNGGVSAALTLPEAVSAGKYIKITYAKPYATNNGSANRNQDNSADDKITVGGEVIDLKANCDFDKWYTTTVKVNSAVSKLDINLGRWGAMAISYIEVLDGADTMEFTSPVSEKYITSENQTVEYSAKVYNSITTLMDSKEIVARGTADTNASVTYSVNGYGGVSIAGSGLLTITPSAQAGTVTVSAEYGSIRKELSLELMTVSDADGVKIVGDELVKKGETLTLKAIPTSNGTVIPERATAWNIEGDNHGASIENGVLTVPDNATSGNITVKATLKTEGSQASANISDTFIVTIKGETASPYVIKGIFLKNCAADLAAAKGIDSIAVDADSAETGYKVVIKAVDANGIVIAQTQATLDNIAEGVTEVKAPLEFNNASQIKAYIINSNNEIISNEIYKTDKTLYKNVPLVADWITGEKSGLGMGKGIIAPTGAPYGVDPDTVDVADLNVKYTYDDNYVGATADNALWYKTGAYLKGSSNGNNSIYARDGVDWEQKALPIGNGYMGGMLFGLPDKDQIQINEETFWAAGYRGVQSEVKPDNVNKNMSEGINGFMSVGNIFVDFNMPENAEIKNYYRDLNLDESVAHVRYEYDGKTFNREYFASYPKEVLAFRYTGDELNFEVKPVSMHPGEVTVNNGEITIIGKLKDSEPYSSGGNAAWNQESDLEYCTIIKVIADNGTVTDGYNTVNVSGSTGVTILVAAATDYDKDQFELNSDGTVNMTKTPYKSVRGVQAAIEKATTRINGAASMSYNELKAEHIADYKSQFDKVKFSLTDNDEVCTTPTDELQKSYDSVVSTKKDADGTTNVSYDETKYNNLDKHLEELHYNYARYMMISSSRSNTMPSTLQGKWCQSTAEIWGSCYCININMEMNYWFAGGANLLDSGKSLIGWFNSQIPAGRITAKNMYKVTPKSYKFENGKMTFTDSADNKDDVFIMHTKQAIMGTTDLTGGTSIQSAGNTAWLMYNLWDLYQTTGNKELLENDLYPIMRKAANFYTQYLYTKERKISTDTEKYPDGYYYTTWAGRSPEQGPTHEGIKYDLQLVAGMYDYTIAAAEILGVDADKVAAWKEIRNHLEIPVELGADGQIKEWAEETTYNTDANGKALGDPVHRHISHLVGLYPGTLINRDTPELLNGAKIVLQKRGDDSTGWSCSNKFLLWARTLEGDKALELFRYQLAKKTYSNLFDTHAPFQIDGNFGSAAGVMELLMQSQTGDIYILPALPQAWDKGEISGIKAKNGAEVSIKWNNNKATEIKIVPANDGDITIGYDKDNIISMNGNAIEFTNGKYIIANAKKGKIYTFSTAQGSEVKREITELTANSVKATGYGNENLIVAGYDENGVMQKCDVIDRLESNLIGYDECKTIKAFLWDSLNSMKPYDCKEIELTK